MNETMNCQIFHEYETAVWLPRKIMMSQHKSMASGFQVAVLQLIFDPLQVLSQYGMNECVNLV